MLKLSQLSAVALAAGVMFTAAAPDASALAMRAGFNSVTMVDNDDSSVGPVLFGFASAINFNGVNFSSGFVNNNGNMTLNIGLATFTPSAITAGTQPIFAPFFADVDTRSRTNGAQPTRYGTGTVGGRDAFGITWDDVGFFNTQYHRLNSFQLVLIDRADLGLGNFDFEFNHDDITWETGQFSGGDANGLGGTSAAMGWSNGAGSFYQHPGSLVNGALLNGGSNALITNHLNSQASVGGTTLGRYFFQVRNGRVQPVPEPMSLSLMGLGLVAVGVARRRRKSV